MTTTFVFLARKGGVGRTTLTANVAGEFARRGEKVLCVDLDGQASLSRFFFGSERVEQLRPETTSAAVIADYGSEADEVIHPTAIENVCLLPSCDALEKLARPEVNLDEVSALRDFLRSVWSQFSVILIDTPPNTTVSTTISGIIAADFVLSPVPADAFGTQSMISVQRAVSDAVRFQPQLSILGYVLNQLQKNSVNDAYVKMVRQLQGKQVFDTEIPLAVAYREAMAIRTPISHHKPKLKPAKTIAALVDEITQRIQSSSCQRRVA